MEVGTAELIQNRDDAEPRSRTSRLVGGSTGNGGGNDQDNGGGGGGGRDESSRSGFDPYPETQDEVPDKSKFVTWFLLIVVLMTFGGMIGAYIVISTNGAAEWQPFNLPMQVWISTALIAASGVTYHLAKTALFADRFKRCRQMLIATTVFGAAFISSQILVWLALVNRGFYMQGNPYAGFFYILTAAHAVHVLGGIIALGAVLLRTWNFTAFGPELAYRRNLTRSIGWYWHFMGGLWIVLLVILGFWK